MSTYQKATATLKWVQWRPQAKENKTHIRQGQAETCFCPACKWEIKRTTYYCLHLKDWTIQGRQSLAAGGARQHDEGQWTQAGSDSVYKWGFYLCLSWILTWIPSMITLKLKIMTSTGYCTILRGDKFCENLGKINREIASNRSIIMHSKYQRRDVSFYGSCWIYNSWKRVWTADFWIVCCMLKIDFIMR